jgi:hypothetical protein
MDNRTASEALAVAISAGVPVFLWGSPGTGNVQRAKELVELARRNGYRRDELIQIIEDLR